MQFASIETVYPTFLKLSQKVSTDTRNIIPESIFFALKGENFDGNTFVEQALKNGATCCVIDSKDAVIEGKTFLVEDVLAFLQKLANHHRKQFQIPFIAVTGSNGKTTTKELITAVLSKKFKTLATVGNLNNHIGVPLTLLSVTREHEMVVVEMGANHVGEIELLSKIAEPDYGIITNIGKAHLEGFGGIEGVKKGKGELFKYILGTKGIVFIHADDQVVHDLAIDNEKVTYGTKKLYDVLGKQGEIDNCVAIAWKTRYSATELKSAPLIKSNLVGSYNYSNLLCAACVGHHFQIEEELINNALMEYTPTNSRSQLMKTDYNTLVLDCYNANPSSMKVAIENFAKMQGENKMLILGDMLELGEESKLEHELVLNLLKEKQLENFIVVGPVFKSLCDEHGYLNSDEANNYLKKNKLENHLVLVKGSRGIKLEKVIESL